jgi:hypothetical protein
VLVDVQKYRQNGVCSAKETVEFHQYCCTLDVNFDSYQRRWKPVISPSI